jgi:hypothetical protein
MYLIRWEHVTQLEVKLGLEHLLDLELDEVEHKWALWNDPWFQVILCESQAIEFTKALKDIIQFNQMGIHLGIQFGCHPHEDAIILFDIRLKILC